MVFCLVLGIASTVQSTHYRPRESQLFEASPVAGTTVRVANVGLGSTGTHLPYEIACLAGIPSCHYFSCCHVGETARKSHDRMILWFWRVVGCAKGWRCHATEILDDLRTNLRGVLASGIRTLHDMPYPLLASELAALGVRLMQTTREPAAWAEKRRDRACLPDPICRRSTGPHFDLVDCLASHSIVADAIIPYLHVQNLEKKLAAHQAWVPSLVPPEDFFHLCAWDDDVQDRILDAAAFLKANSSDPRDLYDARAALRHLPFDSVYNRSRHATSASRPGRSSDSLRHQSSSLP